MAGVKVPLVAMHHAYVVTERIEGIQVRGRPRRHAAVQGWDLTVKPSTRGCGRVCSLTVLSLRRLVCAMGIRTLGVPGSVTRAVSQWCQPP